MSPIILLVMVQQDHDARRQAAAREHAARLDRATPREVSSVGLAGSPTLADRLARTLRNRPWSPKSGPA
jgi:hypothetical protein